MKEKGQTKPVPQAEHTCDVCGERAVAHDQPHWYCYDHHMLWTKCWTHEKMVKEHATRAQVH